MSNDHPDPDELPALVAALQRKCNALAGENQELWDVVENQAARIEVLEERAPDPSRLSYEEMDKSDKVTVLRSRLAEIAKNRGGTHKMEYGDVIDAFHGHPSAGHAYDLMELAGKVDGFDYGESPDGTKRLTVKIDATNADADFHAANKATSEGAI